MFEQFVEPNQGHLINKTKAAGKYTMILLRRPEGI
jgi:hypothetical protein